MQNDRKSTKVILLHCHFCSQRKRIREEECSSCMSSKSSSAVTS